MSSGAEKRSLVLDAPPALKRRRAVEVLVAGCAVCLLIAAWQGRLLVIRAHVIPPVIPAVALAGLVLLAGGPRTARRARSGAAVVAVCTVTLLLGLATWGLEALDGSTYHVLTPRSGRGCGVLASESSFVFAGGGSIYLLQGETGWARRVASFTTDDGERPLSDGSGILSWDGEQATLTGPLWDSKRDGPLTFSC